MADFNAALKKVSGSVLKRELSDDERLEFQDLASALGADNVEDYLYILMVFKRNEDKINGEIASFGERLNKKIEELSKLEKKIDETLESSIERVLGEGAARIGADMGDAVAKRAKDALTASGEYHTLRGQIILVSFLGVALTLFYWLGAANVFMVGETQGPIETILFLPAGWCLFISCATYSYCWGFDNWRAVKESAFYKAALAGISLAAVAIIAAMFLLGKN
jgi:ElaB/YqjD/DUF883 family membrane-anchored ribosome-binding protein